MSEGDATQKTQRQEETITAEARFVGCCIDVPQHILASGNRELFFHPRAVARYARPQQEKLESTAEERTDGKLQDRIQLPGQGDFSHVRRLLHSKLRLDAIEDRPHGTV